MTHIQYIQPEVQARGRLKRNNGLPAVDEIADDGAIFLF
jgi:hypothetical protein